MAPRHFDQRGKLFSTALAFFILLVAAHGQPHRTVDAATLDHKFLFGYQGWFACPGDGSPPNRWVHWFRKNQPASENATVDFWPDISELKSNELFSTAMTLPDGSPAKVYSTFNAQTVARHFQWMQANDLDGVFLQRFTTELAEPRFFALRNQVAANVQTGAEKSGRVFAVMYDISGQPTNTLLTRLTNDWNFLVHTQRLIASPRYLHHQGKAVVALWGFGFAGRHDTPQLALDVISFFKNAGCAVIGGVPTHWRTLKNDAQTNAAWRTAFRAFDVLSPWSVGRYQNDSEADAFSKNMILPDFVETKRNAQAYLPVIWPGFSWHNLNGGEPNQIPRQGGKFFWRQAFNAINDGSTMLYGAMFDEMDEGTAIFKLAPTAAQLPAQGKFVSLDADGTKLPSDWYLRLANEAGKMLRQEIPITNTPPISP